MPIVTYFSVLNEYLVPVELYFLSCVLEIRQINKSMVEDIISLIRSKALLLDSMTVPVQNISWNGTITQRWQAQQQKNYMNDCIGSGRVLRLDGSTTMRGHLNVGIHYISNLADPSNP